MIRAATAAALVSLCAVGCGSGATQTAPQPGPSVQISSRCDAAVKRFEANLASLKTTQAQVAASLTASLTACHSRPEWEQADARYATAGSTPPSQYLAEQGCLVDTGPTPTCSNTSVP
jgi:hypothetical protein